MLRKRKKIKKSYELVFKRVVIDFKNIEIRCNKCSLYRGTCPNLRIAFECDKVNGGSLSFNRIQYVI